ncbi:hypothetical protein KUTeg_003640 [Tegillarca granosa]|uniref:Lysophospholipid acyltransferase 7 n=1 Tax=Tegillarca granosa TaxID=220873 RepID=A0ABQ9FMP6_TEGGR|nr:hypothetical protein KUTeg_003640 [Tegillarca granosa]
MTPDDFVYCLILVASIPFGHLVKITNGPGNKRLLTSALGVLTILLTCRLHIFHSLITTLVSCLIIRIFGVRKCHTYNFIWCFGYLVFFRTCHYFGLPKPPAISNAVQLLLTLRMTGISFELYDTNVADKKNPLSEEEVRLKKKYQDIDPSVLDIIHYAYCYVGLFTGPYYKYRTFYDMLHNDRCMKIDTKTPLINKCKPVPYIAICFLFFNFFFSIETDEFFEQPFWFRLFYMVPMFIIFRTRLYTAWLLSECICITSTLGAYPADSKPKCGQGPSDLKGLDERVSVTMAVSAFWHGIHPGYYLTFLLVPVILVAENGMIAAFRENKDEKQQKLFDWGCLFFKMRGFDYMCMGFLLLRLDATLAYWSSIYFIGHIVTILFIIIGNICKPKKSKKVSGESNTKKQD